MLADLQAWLNLGVRWLHVIAGVAWIGSSFYFMWLDASLRAGPETPKGVQGDLWAVHGGGFYHKRKYLSVPPDMPAELHWFKWEAYTTWISGILLLTLIYYIGASVYLIDPAKIALTPWQAVAIGAGFLAGGWIVYDLLCRAIAHRTRLFAVVWFTVLTAAAFGLVQVFSNRGAFIHLGALIGTAMVGNVFLVIIPNQRKIVAAMLAGQPVDPALGKQGKLRSVHNNYMTLAVLFLMVSNHYPNVVDHPLNWLLAMGIGLSGAAIRHYFNEKNAGRRNAMTLVNGLALFAAVAIFALATTPKPPEAGVAVPTFPEVQAMIGRHCQTCHSANPTHRGFTAPPNGVAYDTPEQIRQFAPRIYERAVANHSMPLGNETGMTQDERARLGAWIKAGAK
ncbi:MAG TPA: urate hydroxylase PuuD [Caulobacter sp.]|nr:urate hydroxylase PuuD [Caulobacter sp.]